MAIEDSDSSDDEIHPPLTTFSHLYSTLENDANGQPGGILITSVAQQVIDGLWIGGFTAAESLHFLEKEGIRHILSLGHFKPHHTDKGIDNKIIVILDAPQQNIVQYFDETFEYIHGILESGERVLVHCVAGVSRSATIITAYLMRLKQIRYKAALAMLKRVRPFVSPNDGFLEQLRLYQTMGNRVDVDHPEYKKFLERHPNQDEAAMDPVYGHPHATLTPATKE
ncbi:hypothetical protein NQZ79_g7437 [Umbelopsis isabellina]|nr:hypothetical protein NQZ79_g7437 [Umbelopsis isabellina]